MTIDREERIRELAHHIWESEGCPQGQALRHWAMAERLHAASEPQSKPRASTASPSAGAGRPAPAAAPARAARTSRARKPEPAPPTKGKTR